MENTQEMLKLMQQMEKANRRQVFFAGLQCLFSLTAAICCAVLLVTVVKLMPQVQELALRMDTILTNIDTVTQELAAVDLGQMVQNVDSLVSDVGILVGDSQSAVNEAMTKLNTLDLEALNQAIKDLSDVIEPLAKFANLFK